MLAKVSRMLSSEQSAAIERIDAVADAERLRVLAVIRGSAPCAIDLPPLPSPPAGTLTRKQKRAYQERLRRAQAKRAKIERENIRAAKAESEAERVAPAVRRHPIVDASGTVIRSAAVESDGSSYRRANAIASLQARMPKLITNRHVDACQRFLTCLEEVGGGIGLGASDYLRKSAGGSPGSGVSDAKQSAILRQCSMRAELDGALAWIGAAEGILVDILFLGASVASWARRQDMDQRVALGILIGALNRVADFYDPPRAARIRSAGVERTSIDML